MTLHLKIARALLHSRPICGENFTSGATFLFLAGNYSLQTTMQLFNISDVMLTARENDCNVYYGSGDAIRCENITNFRVQKVTFAFRTSS